MESQDQSLDTIKEIRSLKCRIEYLENRLDFYLGLKQSNIEIKNLPLFGLDMRTLKYVSKD